MRTMKMEKTSVSVIEGKHRDACPIMLMGGGMATNTGSEMQHIPTTLAMLRQTCSISCLSMAEGWEAYHQVCFRSLLNICGMRSV
jgi:hypothetical protein